MLPGEGIDIGRRGVTRGRDRKTGVLPGEGIDIGSRGVTKK